MQIQRYEINLGPQALSDEPVEWEIQLESATGLQLEYSVYTATKCDWVGVFFVSFVGVFEIPNELWVLEFRSFE